VFLNEVAELPLSVQAKLLSALEAREVTRVGGVRAREFDVRFIAATNQELEQRVERGEFRQDLFFRLNGVTIRIPPLRERLSELPLLLETFVRESALQNGRSVTLSDSAYQALFAHSWPGNVRELRSVIERAALLATTGVIEPEDLDLLPSTIERTAAPRSSRRVDGSPLRQEMVALERQRIEEALRECDGNQTRAAKLLGMSRRTLVKRLGEYSLTKKSRRE
jgi:two-component system response regulator AtoC